MNGVLLALLSHMRARHEVAAPGAASDWAKAKAACPAVPAPRTLDEEQTEATEADASPRGKLELLFPRPVAVIHMRDLLPADELSALNQRLVEAFFQMQKDAPVHRHDNDGLYWWSQQHCRDCLPAVAHVTPAPATGPRPRLAHPTPAGGRLPGRICKSAATERGSPRA